MMRPHSTPYFSFAALQAIDRRLHHRFMREPAFAMKARREAHLGIDHAVAVHVLDELERHALHRLPRLHHRDGVGESFQIFRQRAAVRAAMKPLAEGRRVRLRQALRSRRRRQVRSPSAVADHHRDVREAELWEMPEDRVPSRCNLAGRATKPTAFSGAFRGTFGFKRAAFAEPSRPAPRRPVSFRAACHAAAAPALRPGLGALRRSARAARDCSGFPWRAR